MEDLDDKAIDECSKILKGETFTYYDHECVILSDAEKCYKEGYKAGAEWQKEQLINKACQWMEDNLLSYWQQCVTDPEEFIKEFHKAMEE